jgi:hypothetical protein
MDRKTVPYFLAEDVPFRRFEENTAVLFEVFDGGVFSIFDANKELKNNAVLISVIPHKHKN